MARNDNKGRIAKAPDQRRSHQTRSKQNRDGAIPSRDQVVEYLDLNPNNASKRDIAKAFGIRGDDRIILKALLKEMEDDGVINRTRKTYRRTAILPSVTVIEIPRDADPEYMIGHPDKWDEDDGDRPTVLILAEKDAKVVPGPGDRILARLTQNEDPDGPAYRAKPMKVLDQPRKSLIGVVRMVDRGARLVPVERKGREMKIFDNDLGGAKDGDLVEVEQSVAGRQMVPKARVINVIGNPLSEKAVSLIALHNLEIPHRFPNSVIAESEAAKPADLKGREDWRELPFVTIDPATAKDHDDAVYAQYDEDSNNEGGFVVYVAIADVSYYVRPGSEMDNEALVRGNSVYFPDRVVPMLPERISNNLCSLIELENRAAMGLRMVFDADGNKKSHTFHRALIRSAAKLSYQQAQTAIDGHPDDKTQPLLEPILKPLFAAFEALEAAQKRRGPLALDLPERRLILNENGLVQDVHVPERLTAHRLIEEMMIQSNVCAAETLEQHKVPLLYRVHDAPSQQKLIGLQETLASLEIKFNLSDTVRPEQFNQILKKAEHSDNPHLVSEMVLRSQAQAEYSNENLGHFGLNLRRYAHFTSPIRRYADLIVHRALIRAIGLGDDGLPVATDKQLPAIGQQISMTERRAMSAERETTDRLLAYFLADQVGASFTGRIAGVIGGGLFVRLDKSGADGFIPAATLGSDYFVHDEGQQALIGQRSGERFRIGDQVEVRLVEAAPLAGSLRFEMLSEGPRIKPPGSRRSHTSAKNKKFGSGRRRNGR